jgi:hypothetical protein
MGRFVFKANHHAKQEWWQFRRKNFQHESDSSRRLDTSCYNVSVSAIAIARNTMVNRAVSNDLKWVANGTLTSPALSWYLYLSQAKNSVEGRARNKKIVDIMTSFRHAIIVYGLVLFSIF